MPLLGRKKLNKAIGEVYLSANNNVRGVYLAGLANVIQETPVDSGRARNNWFLSVDIPDDSVTTSTSSGLATIRSLRKMPLRVLDRKIYLSNNLPYIGALEYGGHSKQAPNGMVRKNLILMQNKIRAL